MACSGVRPPWRCAASAKSTSMMPFFLTIPIKRMIPMKAMMVSSAPNRVSASKAPRPADGRVERGIGGEVPGDGRGRILRLVIDGQRRVGFLNSRDGGERHLGGAARYALGGAAADKNAIDVCGILLKLRIDLKDHAILVALGENGRNLALRERIVERIVDVLDLDAKPGRSGAVDHHIGLQAAQLPIGGDVDDARDAPDAVLHPRQP